MGKLTKDEITTALRAALEAGRQAGNSRIQELKQQTEKNNEQPVFEECGNAMAMVKMDGRSQLARAMKDSPETGISVSRMSSRKFKGYYAVQASLEIQGDEKVNLQNSSTHEKTAEAIAKSLKDGLGLEATVLYWRS